MSFVFFFFKASPPSALLRAAVFLPSIYLHAAEDCSGDAVSGNYLTQKINVEVCLNCYCIPNRVPCRPFTTNSKAENSFTHGQF